MPAHTGTPDWPAAAGSGSSLDRAPRMPARFFAAAAIATLAAPLLAPHAHAAPPPGEEVREKRRPGLVTKGEISAGALLIASNQPGLYIEAPLVAAHVEMDIAGPVIRTVVTQRFTNPTDRWVEATYAFPLPEGSAVDTLKIVVGDRFIEGEVREREEARILYEEAAAAGQRAGLVEQERPNLFTTSLANIGPNETIAVQIEYQDKASLDDGVWSTRFPVVVAPRYNPQARPAMVASNGASFVDIRDPVPDRDRISPPVLHPDNEPSGAHRLPVTFDIDIRAGAPVAEVASRTHALRIARDGNAAHVTLADGEVPADRDFVLSWTPEPSALPRASLFQETRNGQTYVMGVVQPPKAEAPARQDRETIFVIDNSGSMSGDSMDQAKQGLLMALDRLRPDDEFNIIRFDDTMDMLFRRAVPASPENIADARRFVRSLQANGGTEMLPALRAALVDPEAGKATSDGEVRQIVFITDGAIGNEAELFAALTGRLGRSRLFTVGIGSAPNAFFMSRAARLGRGTFTYIDDASKVAEQSAKLFAALENPVMTDLSATLPPGAADAFPSPLPDLYQGEPVTFMLRAEELSGEVSLSGRLGQQAWNQTLRLSDAQPAAGIAQLWARAKIESIEESRFLGADYTTVDAGVLKTALDFHLVSRLTSLVAIDRTPPRPAGETMHSRSIATMLPAGWNFAAVFGPEADARARAMDRLPDGVIEAIKARETSAPALEDEQGMPLPQTAANWRLSLLIGLLVSAFGAAVLRGRLFARPRLLHLRARADRGGVR